MAYIDRTFFDAYTTTHIPAEEFPVLAERASDVIDAITLHRIGGADGLSRFSAQSQECIRKAAAAQTETMYLQGGLATVTGDGADMKSASIGKFSYSTGGSGLETINDAPLSPLVRGYLWPTGLLYAGVICVG